ncbi:hypothetical protein KRP22_013960 [Phytophthora ramorum]|nr:DNA topoisomerase 2-binding protein 1 [Phytophthora ramorum]
MGVKDRMFAGLCLCSTGLELDIKEQVRKIVVACGGSFQDNLNADITTHLIAEAVGSRKHRAAVAHDMPVASPRWVFESFRAKKLLDTKDFGLKLLEGLGVCTAGLTVKEKETVEQLATTHGAQYDGRLELGFTNVLIAQHPEGAKYEAAVANGIPVVHLGWLYACVERDMLVEEEEFALRAEAENASLQPTYIALNQQRSAQELVSTLPEIVSKYRRGHNEGRRYLEEEDEEDWMDLFDGCVLYLLGFSPQMKTLLQRLIRTGMGTIYHNVVIRQVTHVVVSASLSDRQTLEAIQSRVITAGAEGEVYFVSASWLLDCVRCQDLQPEELYPVEFDVHAPEPVPGTGADALHLEGSVGVSIPQAPIEYKQVEADAEASLEPVTLSEDLLQDGDGRSILATRGQANLSPRKKRTNIFAGYSFLLLCRDPEDKHLIKPMLKSLRGELGGAEAIALEAIDFHLIDPKQFAFVSHAVVCTGALVDQRAALEIQQRIHDIQRNNRDNGADQEADADLDDRPVKRTRHDLDDDRQKPRQRMLQFVSDLWVNCSLAARTKLSFTSHELFGVSANQPRALFTAAVPLSGFQDVKVSTSVYRDVEQLVVAELLRVAGAHVTRKMSEHNTHLVCRIPHGMKYVKAMEWGLHVVKARWVVDSLLQGTRLSEHNPDFQVADEDEPNFAQTASQETALSQSSPRS